MSTGRAGGRTEAARKLLAHMEDNLTEHVCHLHRRTRGMTVTEHEDVLLADSGLDDGTFNIVCGARFATSGEDPDAASRVRETARELAETKRAFSWWVGPLSAPENLSALLTGEGMPASAVSTAMAAAIDGESLPELDAPGPAELTVQKVTTAEQLADYATVFAANWDPVAETVLRFAAETAPAALSRDCRAVYLVGYVEDRPVASAEVMLRAGVAGLYNICTVSGRRGKGYGTAMTLAALRLARTQRYETAVLQASDQSRSLYERLGFVPVGTFTEHTAGRPEPAGEPEEEARESDDDGPPPGA